MLTSGTFFNSFCGDSIGVDFNWLDCGISFSFKIENGTESSGLFGEYLIVAEFIGSLFRWSNFGDAGRVGSICVVVLLGGNVGKFGSICVVVLLGGKSGQSGSICVVVLLAGNVGRVGCIFLVVFLAGTSGW